MPLSGTGSMRGTGRVSGRGGARPGPRLVAAAAMALAGNSFVVLGVNYWIYSARSDYIALNPDLVRVDSPTISRAISEPSIGEPFAVGVSLAALLLPFCVAAVFMLYRETARTLARHDPLRSAFVARGAHALVVFQLGASTGMVVLSNFRFPTANDMHMLGSYVFFVSQALLILTAAVLCRTCWRMMASAPPALVEAALIRPAASRARAVLGALVAGAGAVYGVLFLAKDIEWAGQGALYEVYVLWEPALISGFLAVLALYHVEFWAILRRAMRGA